MKPITIQIKETEEAIMNVINESKLPAIVCRYILEGFIVKLDEVSVQQLHADTQQYKEAMKNEEDKV